MGGSAGKAIDRVKKQLKRTRLEDVATGGATFIGRETQKETGIKGAGIAINPSAYLQGEAAEKLYDQPMALKAAEKRMSAEFAAESDAQLKRLKGREAQEGAEKDASDRLLRGRARQSRRRRKSGRGSTFLAGKLGAVGGETYQDKKSLLGL